MTNYNEYISSNAGGFIDENGNWVSDGAAPVLDACEDPTIVECSSYRARSTTVAQPYSANAATTEFVVTNPGNDGQLYQILTNGANNSAFVNSVVSPYVVIFTINGENYRLWRDAITSASDSSINYNTSFVPCEASGLSLNDPSEIPSYNVGDITSITVASQQILETVSNAMLVKSCCESSCGGKTKSYLSFQDEVCFLDNSIGYRKESRDAETLEIVATIYTDASGAVVTNPVLGDCGCPCESSSANRCYAISDLDSGYSDLQGLIDEGIFPLSVSVSVNGGAAATTTIPLNATWTTKSQYYAVIASFIDSQSDISASLAGDDISIQFNDSLVNSIEIRYENSSGKDDTILMTHDGTDVTMSWSITGNTNQISTFRIFNCDKSFQFIPPTFNVAPSAPLSNITL